MKQRGFSITELLIVIAMMGMLLLVALPGFTKILKESRLDGALRHVVGDVRNARTQATMTGWQYRIVGFAAGSSNAKQNQYRILGRSSSAVAWPADLAPQTSTSTQFAGRWVDMVSQHAGTRLVPRNGTAQPRFELTFDSRGAATMTNSCFAPFQIVGASGTVKSVRVSAIGGIRVL